MGTYVEKRVIIMKIKILKLYPNKIENLIGLFILLVLKV